MLYYFMFINMKKVLLFFITLLAISWVLFIGLLATWYISIDWLLWKYINNEKATTTTPVIKETPSQKIANRLEWTYSSNNWKYTIEFNNNWTLRWREITEIPSWERIQASDGSISLKTQQYESFYEWTYEYLNWEYLLYVKWELGMNVVFHVKPQKNGYLLVNGWMVNNVYFIKTIYQ